MANVRIDIEVITRAANAALRGVQAQAKKTQTAFGNIQKSAGKLAKGFAILGTAVAAISLAAVTAAFGKFVSGSINAAKELEVLSTKFEVLTGSTAVAKQTMEDLQQFAANTPFQLKDLASSTAKLIGFGFSADEAKDKLSALGDVASASGSGIGEISLIFGQISAAGKLTGERLLQLQERAIPIGPAIAKTMGIAESAVKDAVSAGKVDFATFEKAFESLNDTGQFAFDGMAKASLTLQGRISTLTDNFSLLQNDFGKTLLPALKAGATALTEFIKQFRATGEIENFGKAIAQGLPKAISFLVDALQFLNSAFQNTRLFLNFVSASFDQFVGGLAQVAINVIETANKVKEFFGVTPDTTNIDLLKSFIDVTKESAAETELASSKIILSRDSLDATLEASGKFAIDTYNKEIEAIKATGDETVIATQKKVEAIQTFATFQQQLADAEQQRNLEFTEGNAILAQNNQDQKTQLLIQGLGLEQAATVAFQARMLENEGKHQQAVTLLRQKTAQADQALKKQEEARDKKRVSDRKATLGSIASLTSSNNKTLFNIGKAAAISQATIDGFGAVQRALNSAPPPFNFVLAALVGAATAANVSSIAAQQPPAFEQGGIVPGSSFSGDNVAARVNSGEMILNREQQSNLFNLAQGGSGSGASTTNITVELDGEVVGRAVSRQVRDGLELGEIA